MDQLAYIPLESEGGFSALFEHISSSILIVDESGRLAFLNPSAEKLWGYSHADVNGQFIEKLIPGYLSLQPNQSQHPDFSAPKTFSIPLERPLLAQHRDGTLFPISLDVKYLSMGSKKITVVYVTDVSEKEIAAEAFRHSEEITRLIMKSALDAIVCIDTAGIITVWNPQAEKIFGWQEEEIKGKLLTDTIIPEQYRQAHERGMKHYLQSGEGAVLNRVIEITALHRTGKEFPIELTIIPIKEHAGLFFCAFMRDITERKNAEEEKKRYAEELEQKNLALEQFAYIVSHDLQEPLRTIEGIIDFFKRKYQTQLDANADQYLNFVNEASGRMRNLIKSLLDYSRLGEDRVLEQVDCNHVLHDVLSDLTMAIKETHTSITLDPLPTLLAYPVEIKQLFQNLLSNSIKFRKKDERPAIHIAAQRENDHWQFSIQDNGIGIAEKNQEKIFVFFQRLHAKNEYAGTGIGLAYCKKIVELHEGRIWVVSQPGEGSTFHFTIEK
ncbi:MAG: PAS domain S-box protein [Bacteroidota bacterium]